MFTMQLIKNFFVLADNVVIVEVLFKATSFYHQTGPATADSSLCGFSVSDRFERSVELSHVVANNSRLEPSSAPGTVSFINLIVIKLIVNQLNSFN